MNQAFNTSVPSTISSDPLLLFAKPYDLRSLEEKDKQINLLNKLGYFRRLIYEPNERQDLTKAILKYLKYVYYPQGSVICDKDDHGSFGIIVLGKAIAYRPKKETEIKASEQNITKRKCFQVYNQYMAENNLLKGSKRISNILRKNSQIKSQEVLVNSFVSELPSARAEIYKRSNMRLINELLHGNVIARQNLEGQDLTLEEKLLLLNNKENVGNYVKDGVALYTKEKELREGDTVCDAALVVDNCSEEPIIAAEDVHMLTIPKKKFLGLFERNIMNLNEREKFISSMFPQLDRMSVITLCACIDEKLCYAKEHLYGLGEESDAIYIVRAGSVQLSSNEEKNDDYEISTAVFDLNRSPQKRLNKASNMQAKTIETGTIFGTGEIFSNCKRNHTAICSANVQTFLYVIRKEVYLKCIEGHFDAISAALRSLSESTMFFNKTSPKKARKVETEITGSPLRRVMLKMPRLMSEIEAKYRKMNNDKPELILETKAAPVLYQEDRSSRLTGNRVEITVCEVANQNYLSQRTTEPMKGSSTSLKDEDLTHRCRSSRETDGKIQAVKTKLFIRNQSNKSKRKTVVSKSKEKVEVTRPATIVPDYFSEKKHRPKSCVYSDFEPFLHSRHDNSPVKNREVQDYTSIKGRLSQIQTPLPSHRIMNCSQHFSLQNSLAFNHTTSTPTVPSLGEIKSPEGIRKKLLGSGTTHMLRRVTSIMPKRHFPRKPETGVTPLSSMHSLTGVTSGEELDMSRTAPTRTTLSYKTITSLDNVDGAAKLATLASLDFIEDNQEGGSEMKKDNIRAKGQSKERNTVHAPPQKGRQSNLVKKSENRGYLNFKRSDTMA